VPFGFKDAYFYDQIQYAADGLHVFTYTFINDVGDFFATLLSGGLQRAVEARASFRTSHRLLFFMIRNTKV